MSVATTVGRIFMLALLAIGSLPFCVIALILLLPVILLTRVIGEQNVYTYGTFLYYVAKFPIDCANGIGELIIASMKDIEVLVRPRRGIDRHQRMRGFVAALLDSTRETISETRADIDYEYNRALRENRLRDARWIRFSGRFIILRAVTYDLVVTLFEHITDNVKNIFRLG